MFLQKMLVYVLLVCVAAVQCYPGGQVSGACGSLMPNHDSNSPQTSTAPFTVTVNKSVFNKTDQITVTLNGLSGNQFEGLLLQANLVGSTVPIGSFTVESSSVQTISCSGAARAVSQTSNSKKTTIQATWTPASDQLGNTEFRATFVKSFGTFWVGVKSAAVTYNGTASGTSSATVAPTAPSNPDCGTTKVCFSQPSGCDPATSTGCYFMAVQTSSDQSEMRIEMFGQSSGYVAIGFSDDQSMGNDDVYICGKDSSNNLQVQHAFNTGKTNPNILALGNVTNIVTSLINGNINCSFTSRNAISTGTRATSTSEYYLMIASGSSNQGSIQVHSSKFVSTTKANLLNPSVVTSGENFPAIVRAHGCLMLISWMTTGSIGMLIARYLKGVAKNQGCFGKDFWFIAHVSLMSLSVTATAIAFIIVFSYAQDWSGGAHPVLGCMVMILTLIQPIVAAFRCDPHHERRFVFNWAHSFLALAIKGLAVAAIFTGLAFFESSDGDGWMMKVMGGFIAWEAIMYILQDLNMRARIKESEICSFGSMKPEAVLLVLYILGNLAFLIALLVGIGTA